MTAERDVERLVERWLVDGIDEMPDRVYRTVLDRVERKPQRRAWRLRTWRLPPMSTPLRLALLAGALLVALVAGAAIMSGAGDRVPVARTSSTPQPTSAALVPVVSPSATPSPVEHPSPTIRSGCDNVTTEGCFLPAGAHRSAAFTPTLTYTLPSGWMTTVDAPSSFELVPSTRDNLAALDAGASSLTGVELERDLAVAAASCTNGAQPGTPRTADAIVRALARRRGLETGQPAPITIGDLSGWTLDLRMAPGAKPSCTLPDRPAGVPELITPGVFHHVLAASSGVTQRLIVLDLPGGGNVTVIIRAEHADLWASFLAQAASIVDSFSFASN